MIPEARKIKIRHNILNGDYFGTLATRLEILRQENRPPTEEMINDLIYLQEGFIISKPIKYTYRMDDLNVSTLLEIWQEVVRGKVNEVRIDDLDLTTTQKNRRTQLRFHGLIAKVKNDKGKQKPGYWLITKRGCEFLKGKVVINRYVITANNKVIDHSSNIEKTEKNKWIHKNEFEVLKDFNSSYTILEGSLKMMAASLQPHLI